MLNNESLSLLEKIILTVTGAATGPGYLGLRALYGLWKKRREETEAQIEEKVEDQATVQIKKIEVGSEAEARLWARIEEQEEEIRQLRKDSSEEIRLLRQENREMFEIMRKHTAESDTRTQDIQERLANEVQKVNGANWIIQQKDKTIADLTAKIEAMQVEMDELNERLQRLEGKSHER